MTLNILGTEYKVKMNVNSAEDKDLKGRMGYCGLASKEIVIADVKTIESWENETDEAIKFITMQTLRHEIIHAYFNESGLSWSSNDVTQWACNEEMVDWLAIQMPKIYKTFKEADCI